MNRRSFLQITSFAGLASTQIVQAKEEADKTKEIFTTGLPELDRLLNGGIRKGHLTVLMANTGMGKTAFCNTVRFANFPTHKGSATVREGSFDFLFLGNSHSIFMKETDITLPETGEPWEKMHIFARDLCSQAMKQNHAAVWTIPTLRKMENCEEKIEPSVYSPPWIRHVSCLLTIRDDGKIHVLKNRYGPCGSVPIGFYLNEDSAMLMQMP